MKRRNASTFSRRTFVKQSGAGLALSMTGLSLVNSNCMSKLLEPTSIKITNVNSNFEREPLLRPFGFKGSAMTNVWQTMAYLKSDSGIHKIGLGTQNVLWSDSKVFAANSENGGNALMYAMSERALQIIKGQSFTSPVELLDRILPEVYDYGKKITGFSNLRKTFALNALVGLDNAAWLLYAAENGLNNFDEMIPEEYKEGLSGRNDKVVSIPALGYGTPVSDIKQMADDGFFIMKIKIGAPGTQAEMLEKDKEFLKNIHNTIGHYETPHTADGKIPYYFDANGRYDNKEDLLRFLDYAESIGALPQIAVVEEPFGERNQEDVRDIVARGPRVAADESAHTDEDALTRIQQGYNCIAVKAIAKTMSMTMKIAQVAYENNVPCFCADLTVNPILVDWNKIVAARLPAFPGLNMGLQETNGWQNYKNWDTMMGYHPARDQGWTRTKNGVYETGKKFMEQSGGILMPSDHYEKMF
ncbi:MAG: L-alanine-DL-glutamate epimerase-like enolase superfamily enzyme [Saprospiraceae bacterium]|jgi:L-alanine-DL-glutamate epimerase-like enolase superfamily enzyme